MPDALLNKIGQPIEYARDKYESVGFSAELADEVLARLKRKYGVSV